ncbi:MAG: nitroreductase family protein [Gemmatimonadota bacterium]|nr:MAG: nitroreductase family protein [Gemmatimonadota bacterium]
MRMHRFFLIVIVFSFALMFIFNRALYSEGTELFESSPFETNPILKAIKERRSIRKFQEKDVDPGMIEILLKAASWAPSANNDQPWKFVIVRNRETKNDIREVLMDTLKGFYETKGIPSERMNSYWSSVFSAPVHIFVFCDIRHIDMDKGWENIENLHNIQGVSAACQNILLAATALDLGSLWMGGPLIVEEKIKTLLEIPQDVQLMAIIAIGYPAHEPLPPVRKPLSHFVFLEKWKEP